MDTSAPGCAFDVYPDDDLLARFEKWVNLGDDRNLAEVWVAGKATAAVAPFVSI